MKYYKVTFENGNYFTTCFNGDIQDAKAYYLGKVFNIGTISDNLQRCTSVLEVM